jgi:hypothetical protein
MADIKVVRLYDSIYGNGSHVFSVIASDSSVRYIFPEGQEAFDGNERVNTIIGFLDGNKPTTTDAWLNIALYNLNSYVAKDLVTEKPLKSVKEAASQEMKELKSLQSEGSGLKLSEQKMNIAADTLLADPDFEAFAYGYSQDLPEEAEKAWILSMIDAAGTRDLNPWLEPWLKGETKELDFSNGLVLRRPELTQKNLTEEEGSI